jgi:anaerobic ribonucleoside-triphosphate reductase activating protein
VLWVQGCALACRGCFNPATHDFGTGVEIDPANLAVRINKLPIRGVTLSGGEPLSQPGAILSFLEALDPRLDVLMYSGFSLKEANRSLMRRSVLLKCDAALMGRYRANAGHPYEGKELVVRTARISPHELQPQRHIELIIAASETVLTGFPSSNGADHGF